MPRYAITFDLDSKAATKALGESVVNNELYGTELKGALAVCGFIEHAEGSVYHTELMDEDESLRVIFNLRTALRQYAPRFCKYVKSIHLFEMKGWSNITDLVKTDEITGRQLMSQIQSSGRSL